MTFFWNRRRAVSMLLGGLSALPGKAASLNRFLENQDAAILLECSGGRVLARGGDRLAGPPGSTLKPLLLAALVRSGKLKAEESILCRGRLRIAGRAFDCSHPPLDTPMRVDTALAYSCNAFAAHFALRFTPAELAAEWSRAGFAAVRPAASPEALQLQALGESGVAVTAEELARAYRRLSAQTPEVILHGLESAAAYGTAQRVRVPGVTIAGKTGSVRNGAGEPLAWFAGFAPSRAPQVAIAVVVRGRSGGADAAPVAGRILEAWKAARL